jgi:hypothetical protein
MQYDQARLVKGHWRRRYLAFPAARVEVRVRGQEVGAGMGPAQGAVVISGAASFTTDEVFMRQAIGAAIVEILPSERTIFCVIAIETYRLAASEDHGYGAQPSGRVFNSARICASSSRSFCA